MAHCFWYIPLHIGKKVSCCLSCGVANYPVIKTTDCFPRGFSRRWWQQKTIKSPTKKTNQRFFTCMRKVASKWLFSTIVLKKTWHRAMMVAWVWELCGLQALGHVNWLRFLSFYSNIYACANLKLKYSICRYIACNLCDVYLPLRTYSWFSHRSSMV